jgi:hypothetical protein
MLLEKERADHFLRVYKDLLEKVSCRKLNGPMEYAEARTLLFSDEVLDTPPTEDVELLRALKSAAYGDFVVARHLRRWSEMIGPDNHVYRVKGISTELRDLTGSWTVVRTAVMQFAENVICDGLIEERGIHIGPNMRKELLEMIRNRSSAR